MKNRLLICVIGGSGSGKSTLENEIVLIDGFSKAISSTTRQKRDGEVDGREYYFLSDAEFDKLKNDNKLLENVEFAGNKYGLSVDEMFKNEDHLVFVVETGGLRQILNYVELNSIDITPVVVFMDITDKERFKNMLKRGDNPVSIQERFKHDNISQDFKKSGIKSDIKVSKLTESTTETVIKDIQEFLKLI